MRKLTKKEEELANSISDNISYYLRHPAELPVPDKDLDNGFSISDEEIDHIINDALEEEY